MDKIVEFIIEEVKKNLKNPKFYVCIILLLLIVLFIFPYIDANFFYYNRIEKRINILQKISKIDKKKISKNIILKKEYNSILSEISNQNQKTFNNIISFNKHETFNSKLLKFISGSFLFVIIAIWIPFMNTFKDNISKLAAFILLLILGAIAGYIGTRLPTFQNTYINYIGFPILQLTIVIIISTTNNKK